LRSTLSAWSSADSSNEPLTESGLSGGLLAVQAYRGNICPVERTYVLHKINDSMPPLVNAASRALVALTDSLQPIIERLHARDLEVLVDLIFRNAGWNRVGVLAETETDIDLALESAVTGERIAVEIKARASMRDYQSYAARYSAMVGFSGFYFVTLSVIQDLEKNLERHVGTGITFWGSRRLAERAARSGLAQWLIDKAT
jgi:hypothetical protein